MSEEKEKNIGNDVGKALKDIDTYAKVLDDLNKNDGANIDKIIEGEPASGDITKAK